MEKGDRFDELLDRLMEKGDKKAEEIKERRNKIIDLYKKIKKQS